MVLGRGLARDVGAPVGDGQPREGEVGRMDAQVQPVAGLGIEEGDMVDVVGVPAEPGRVSVMWE